LHTALEILQADIATSRVLRQQLPVGNSEPASMGQSGFVLYDKSDQRRCTGHRICLVFSESIGHNAAAP
jgi:hypothetical protein